MPRPPAATTPRPRTTKDTDDKLPYAPLFPCFLLTIVALVAMLMAALVEDGEKVGWFTAAGLTATGVLAANQWANDDGPHRLLADAVTIDG